MDVSTVKHAPVQPSHTPKRAESVQPSPRPQSAQHKEPEAKPFPVVKPSPVINSQGQTTGRLLNTTA